MAAYPDARLGGIQFPGGIGQPADFIEIGRGPGEVVAGVPDALLRSDSDDGLRSERAGKRKEED